MATTLYLRGTSDGASDWSSGTNDAKRNTTASGWDNYSLSLTRGAAATFQNVNTVTGPTNGVEIATAVPYAWVSPPLDADVTIAGSIVWNLWASESNMSANVAINGRLEKIDGATGAITLIDQTARTTEVAVTTRAVNNFAETPAAGVACKRGDRLRVCIFGDDAGTMASGFTFNLGYNGTTAAVDGDSYLTLTETLTFVSEPAGSQVFLTDTASDVATASVDREAWTSRGAGVQTDDRNTAAGWTAPLQVTDTAGGTVVDWWTRGLTAFTIGGAVRCNIRGLSSADANATVRVELAIANNDGSSPVTWAAMAYQMGFGTSQTALSFLIAGDDVAVTDGQRLRLRLLIDDYGAGPMVASQTVTIYYAGTSGGASGDTFLTFTQTLTESAPAVRPGWWGRIMKPQAVNRAGSW